MKATIYSDILEIGTADLPPGDVNMGHVYGPFIPNPNYRSSNEPFIRLNVQLENGYFIYAAGGITITNPESSEDGPAQIDIARADRNVIEDFFSGNPVKDFVEHPWETIGIAQKLGFEDELKLELGEYEKESFFSFLKPKTEKHPLCGFELSALCKDGRNDDVLFRINKPGFEYTFAVVHLTWIGKKEQTGFPGTAFYKDFDDFKMRRMAEDML